MNQPKKSFLLAAFFVLFLSFNNSFAQTPNSKQSEPSFDLILQTVVASNDTGGKSDIAPAISGIVKKLKIDFPFSNYRLASTSMQRIGNKSSAESKSVSYTTDKNLAVFSDWAINGFESTVDEKGQDTAQIQHFRFGQRVPIVNSGGVINYEQVGLNAKFSVLKNTPTVVGSLPSYKPDELVFVILTVRTAEK